MRLDKNKIKELYLKGYNAKEISNLLNEKHDTIRRCVNRNFADLKFQHRKARDLNRDIKRAVDSMNNSFISNSSLLKYNRQSYRYNKNNNLVFDEKRGRRPVDLPKAYYVPKNLEDKKKINISLMAEK